MMFFGREIMHGELFLKVMIRLCSPPATHDLTQGDKFAVADVQAKFCRVQDW